LYIYKGYFPYIGGERIPQNYYIVLYYQLNRIWSELVDYLKHTGVNYSVDKKIIEVTVDDDLSTDILVKLYTSFMMVEGEYIGDLITSREFLNHLFKTYSYDYSAKLLELHDFIREKSYDEAYTTAVEALRIVSYTVNTYAKTGRRINQLLFDMLYGNIPQTFINTYTLQSLNAPLSRDEAVKIYEAVAENARRIGLLLRKNYELMSRAERR